MPSTKIDAFLTSRGARPQCEVCGQNTWSLPEDDNPMVVKVQTQTPPPPQNMFGNAFGLSPPVRLPQMGSLNAYIVVCLNCGHIRLHAESVVKQAAGL